MSMEPFFRDEHIVGVMKSFPFMEELNKGIEIIRQTGIISFYSEDTNMPFNIQRNPYKWSKYVKKMNCLNTHHGETLSSVHCI